MHLRDYVTVLRKRWWLLAITVVVAAVSTFVFARLQTPIYRSSVRLEVSGRIDYGQTLAIQARLMQLSERIKTTKIAREVNTRYHLDLAPQDLLEKVTTQAFPDRIHIQIDADDIDPERAELIAKGFAEVFVEDQTARMASVPQQDRIVVTMHDEVTPASLHWPRTRILVIAGALLGLVVGVALAFLLDYLDDTLETVEDVDRYLGLPVLGSIPTARGVEALGAADVRRVPSESQRSAAGRQR